MLGLPELIPLNVLTLFPESVLGTTDGKYFDVLLSKSVEMLRMLFYCLLLNTGHSSSVLGLGSVLRKASHGCCN